MSQLHVIDHPMVQHKLTIMRMKETGSKDFRELLKEIALLMGYELTRDIALEDVAIETPICPMVAKRVSGRKLAIVPILRAGMGMVDGLLSLLPVAKVGHIGLYRDEETHKPVVYFCKLPKDIENRLVILTDPMLATGFDRKKVELQNHSDHEVRVVIESDITGDGDWRRVASPIKVAAGSTTTYEFHDAFGAYWLRLTAEQTGTLSATFIYE